MLNQFPIVYNSSRMKQRNKPYLHSKKIHLLNFPMNSCNSRLFIHILNNSISKKELCSIISKRTNNLWLDNFYLFKQINSMCFNLLWLRSPIFRRSILQNICNVNIIHLQSNLQKKFIQIFTSCSNKRKSLFILLATR